MEKLNDRIRTPLTNHDIYRILPQARGKLIEYSQLNDVVDLSDILLKKDGDFVIVLIEYEQDSGHWIAVLRHEGVLELFNPLGLPHTKRDFISDDSLNKHLGQASMSLKRLLDRESMQQDFEVRFNNIPYQGKSTDIQTCGRHVLLRIISMLTMGMDLAEYATMMRTLKRNMGLKTYDEVVSALIR